MTTPQNPAFASPHETSVVRIDNPHPDRRYMVRLSVPEFTSICPVTGQPDFAHLVVDYVPEAHLVESKSFKLFIASFRNHGAFHEDCALLVAKKLEEALAPHWLRIAGYWNPRGGIPIDVFWSSGPIPDGLWAPDTGMGLYRPR